MAFTDQQKNIIQTHTAALDIPTSGINLHERALMGLDKIIKLMNDGIPEQDQIKYDQKVGYTPELGEKLLERHAAKMAEATEIGINKFFAFKMLTVDQQKQKLIEADYRKDGDGNVVKDASGKPVRKNITPQAMIDDPPKFIALMKNAPELVQTLNAGHTIFHSINKPYTLANATYVREHPAESGVTQPAATPPSEAAVPPVTPPVTADPPPAAAPPTPATPQGEAAVPPVTPPVTADPPPTAAGSTPKPDDGMISTATTIVEQALTKIHANHEALGIKEMQTPGAVDGTLSAPDTLALQQVLRDVKHMLAVKGQYKGAVDGTYSKEVGEFMRIGLQELDEADRKKLLDNIGGQTGLDVMFGALDTLSDPEVNLLGDQKQAANIKISDEQLQSERQISGIMKHIPKGWMEQIGGFLKSLGPIGQLLLGLIQSFTGMDLSSVLAPENRPGTDGYMTQEQLERMYTESLADPDVAGDPEKLKTKILDKLDGLTVRLALGKDKQDALVASVTDALNTAAAKPEAERAAEFARVMDTKMLAMGIAPAAPVTTTELPPVDTSAASTVTNPAQVPPATPAPNGANDLTADYNVKTTQESDPNSYNVGGTQSANRNNPYGDGKINSENYVSTFNNIAYKKNNSDFPDIQEPFLMAANNRVLNEHQWHNNFKSEMYQNDNNNVSIPHVQIGPIFSPRI